jgi:5-methylcytosine-specific restriction enzyme subunit McrC
VSAVTVHLGEWETLRPDHGTPLAERTLYGDVASRKLAEQLTERGCIEVLELARGLELRATSFVGRFSLGEVTITVHPKLSGAPFLNLLRYAYGLRHLDLYAPVGYASTKSAFHDLLIQQLAAEAVELMARGVHRDYEGTRADLANPRGRIEFDRFVRMGYPARAVLPCIHHPRTDDTGLNQVLLAGLGFAARLTADNDLRRHIRRLTKTLSATVSLKRLDPILLAEVRRTMDRRTTAYKPALVLIELLLGADSVSLDGETNHVRIPGFLFDMNRFFQALISRFLHDHLEGYEIEDEYRLKELFCYDSDRNPQKRRAPVQKPDFVIRRNREIAAILDAKYRDLWEKPLPREMLYQLALYALGQSGDDAKAVILYPTLSAAAREQAIFIRKPVSGVKQAEVILRPVLLLELEGLLRSRDWHANRRKAVLASQLSFGRGYLTIS